MSLLIAIALQPAAVPEFKEILAAWTDHAAAAPSADVRLDIFRDSRTRSFGAPMSDADRSVVRLRFDGEQRRLDVPRLTVVRRDGRTDSAESDPERARIEFRNVLLEEQLKGPQMVPTVEVASRMIDQAGAESGQNLSLLDRLVAEAPLWSAQPQRLVNADKLEVRSNDAQTSVIRILEKQPDNRELEIWVEAHLPFRPIRIIQSVEKRPLWQIDLIWSPEESRFATRYVLQTINASGEALEFVEATLASVESPLAESKAFEPITPNRDQPPPPNASAVRARSVARQALDSPWLPAIAIAACAFAIVVRSRTRPAAG